MKKILSHLRFNEKHVPWVLLLFSLLAYLPLVNQVGFYWDDWPMLWFKITQGAEGFAAAFTSDRPFLGNLYKATAALLGDSPLQWQVINVFLRWAVTLAFWWMLKQLWPNRRREVFFISLLLSVYPGFKQMPIVYVWLNAFVMLLAYILSYGMMLKAVRSKSPRGYLLWTVPSVLLYTFCTISTEYYTGLDLCRGVILWVFLWNHRENFRTDSFWKKVWKVFLHWLPYLAVLGVFMVWRVFIFQFPGYQPVLLEQLSTKPLSAIKSIATRTIEDAYTATWGAWTEFFKFPNHEDLAASSGRMFWLFTAAAAFLALFFSSRFGSAEDQNESARKRWCLSAILIGLFMVFCPGMPYWVTGLPIKLSYPYDRFLVAFMFGSSIFMVGLTDFCLSSQVLRNTVLCLFAAMAVGGNILNANSYRKDWQMQQDFIQQLTTRIPDLKEHTLLLTDTNPLQYESDNSLTGLVNLALEPEPKGLDLPYSVNLFSLRYGNIEAFENLEYTFNEFRSAMFTGSPKDVVVYSYSPPACLRILDPEQHSQLHIFPESYNDLIPLSDPKRLIDPKGRGNDFVQTTIFDQPIQENWCYHFQRADLARQTEDWETIASIGDQVLPYMTAGEASEYLPYAEAYYHTRRWHEFVNTIKLLYAKDKHTMSDLCPVFQDLFWGNPPKKGDNLAYVAAGLNDVGCVAFIDPE